MSRSSLSSTTSRGTGKKSRDVVLVSEGAKGERFRHDGRELSGRAVVTYLDQQHIDAVSEVTEGVRVIGIILPDDAKLPSSLKTTYGDKIRVQPWSTFLKSVQKKKNNNNNHNNHNRGRAVEDYTEKGE